MAEELPQEALVRILNALPIKQRSKAACVCKAWNASATVDAVQMKLADRHVPSYLHVALPDGAAQLQAASCPMMSLARSADLTWASAATTGTLLESMPSLERLAFTSMASMPMPPDVGSGSSSSNGSSLTAGGGGGGGGNGDEDLSGLRSLRSLTNLQSLALNTDEAEPLERAVSAAPASLRELELHLTGENWRTDALDKIATRLGSQACGSQLRSLVLRCSHAAVYAATGPLESLAGLTGLTALRMGPNREDVFPHQSPLGFPRLPAFLGRLERLQFLDISVADSPASAPLRGISFEAIRHVPEVKLTLRADTSIRAVGALPASIASVAGLTSLTVHAFTFEDPGGWCTAGYFDVSALRACRKLRTLELQLGTWEAEHCESFELPGLADLAQLQRLRVSVASRSVALGRASRPGQDAGVQELLLALPPMRPALELHIASSMRVVLRNSKVLARAHRPGVLAHSIHLEEPLPQRSSKAQGADGGSSSAGADAPRGGARDQAPCVQQQLLLQQQQQQYVRAPAHVVIAALRDLWPGMEVWSYPLRLPGVPGWARATPELCCHAAARDATQALLADALRAAASNGGADGAEDDAEDEAAGKRSCLLW